MNYIKYLLNAVYRFFAMPINVFGYSFTFWDLIIFNALVAIFCLIIGKLMGGGDRDY